MKKVVLLAAVLFFAISFVQGVTWACQCMPTHDPAIEYEQVDLVFMGHVINISPSASPNFLDVHVMVTGYWKGTVVQFMHVYTGEFDGSCGYEFQLWQEYLIYAVNSTEECCPGVMTSICNRTRFITSAQPDLDFLGPPKSVSIEQVTWGAVKETYQE